MDEKPEKDRVYGSQEEMLEKAKTGYFVRDPEQNLVYCPAGEILTTEMQQEKRKYTLCE
ncbi:MAG: hypothetical protein V8R85_10110 [Frisingicoccus sp.]